MRDNSPLIPVELLSIPTVNRAELLLIMPGDEQRRVETQLSEAVFSALLDRASKHMGYGPSHHRFRSFHAADIEMEQPASAEHRVRVRRKRLRSAFQLPGAPVRVHVLEVVPLPFTAFDNSASALHDVREVERLALRMHRRARLIFERHVNRAGMVVHRVFIDVDLGGAGLEADMPDLKRTVENTVQAIFVQAKNVA